MKFEFYVLNYDFNKKEVVYFNIFRNPRVQERAEQEARKYLRSPSKYSVERSWRDEGAEPLRGFDALCEAVRRAIMSEEWPRREYEISVGDAFEDDCGRLEKWDAYSQALPNIRTIARDVIAQYKEQLKAGRKGENGDAGAERGDKQ